MTTESLVVLFIRGLVYVTHLRKSKFSYAVKENFLNKRKLTFPCIC